MRRILEEEVFERYGFRRYGAERQAALIQSRNKLEQFFDKYSLAQLNIPDPTVFMPELDEVKAFYLNFIDRLRYIAQNKKRDDPLPEENDRKILAEVSKIHRNIRTKNCTPSIEIQKVGLCSNDHDFTEFVSEIMEKFGIVVHPLITKTE